jgi:hypothetical protein
VEEFRGILFKGGNLKHSALQPLSTKDVLDPLVSPHLGLDRWMPCRSTFSRTPRISIADIPATKNDILQLILGCA